LVLLPEITSRLFDKALVTFALIAALSSLLPMCLLSFSFLLLARFAFGACQIVLISYFTAWVDSFS
jgi:hypothetical protein